MVITVESDVMHHLDPQFIHYEPYRKENNNPVASQSSRVESQFFPDCLKKSVTFSLIPVLEVLEGLFLTR